MSDLNDIKLPKKWVRATLRELGVEAQTGFANGRHNRVGDGILHLRPMNLTREGAVDLTDARYISDESDRRVKSGDILFNNTNSPALVGKTSIIRLTQTAAYSNHMTRLRAPDGIVPEFLAMQLHWLWMVGYFQTILNNHVNQASVATGKLLETTVAVPPTAEQYRIVECLESHLSRLDCASRSLSHAEALIPLQLRALHTNATQGMFVVDGEMESDFLAMRRKIWKSASKDKKYKEPVAADLQNSPLRPKCWEVLSLEAVTHPIRVIRYGILMPKVKDGGTIPYVEVKDLRGCSLYGKKLHLTSKEMDERFAGARIEFGDVLLALAFRHFVSS